MRKNNRLLESTTEKVSRVLTEKYGMKVMFRGASCQTDGETIYLPSLPEDMPEDLLGALRGWADHECSHALFTQVEVGGEFSKKHGPAAFSILNTLEDARIERLMSEKYPGSGINIRNGIDYVTGKGTPGDPFKALTWALYFRAKGMKDIPGVAADIYRLLDGCSGEVAKARHCSSTSELAVIAESIWLKIADKFSQGAPQEDPGEQGPQEDENSEKPQDGQDSQSGESNQEQEPAEESAPEEGEQGRGDDSDAQSGDSDPGRQQGCEPEEEEDGPDAGEAQDESGFSAAAQDDGSPAFGQPDLEGEEDASPMGQLKKQLEQAVAGSNKKAADSYRVYTTEHDVAEVPEPSSYDWRAELGELRPQVAGLMRRLVHTLRGRCEKNWQRDQSRGSLDPASLHKLATNSSSRVFRKSKERDEGPTACTLLLDLSASMRGNQLTLCRKLALIFAETLSRLSFPTEIIGFSTTDQDLRYEISKKTGISERDLAMQYSRIVPLYHGVYKTFGEPWKKGASRMGEIKTQALTPLGESLLFAGKRLAQRPEQRKVLFCLTDGEPVTGAWDENITMQHARGAAEKLTAAGIEPVGIGIKENCVEDIFPKHAVIYSLEQLPSAFARELCAVLTGKQKRCT